jgi:hypothetical protein
LKRFIESPFDSFWKIKKKTEDIKKMENKNKTNKDFMGFWAAEADQEKCMINYFIFFFSAPENAQKEFLIFFCFFFEKSRENTFPICPKKKLSKVSIL